MHKTSKRSFVTYFSVISVLFNTESTPGTSSISWETLLQLQRTVSRIWTSFLEVSYNVVTQKSRCPSTTLKLFFYYIFFFCFIKDENHKTCWFLEEKKSSYVWRCFCILWDCWCFLKCTIFFFWINACYVYMKLKYTPAAGTISFKIRGKLYISVAFLILNTYLGAIIWSSVIALKKVEHFKSVLDYLLWKFFSDKFTQKLKQYSISILH